MSNSIHYYESESEDDSEDEPEPKLIRLLYRAFKYLLNSHDDIANRYWERARRRVKKNRKFNGVLEVRLKVDGECQLPLHLAIMHAAPYSLIKEIVRKYKGACNVKFGGMLPLQTACGYPKKTSRDVVQDLRDDNDWERVILLLMKTNPAAIEGSSNTALHYVLEHNPSLKLVQSMIDFQANYTSMTKRGKKRRKKKKKLLLEIEDEQTQLPLHVAVEHVASADVVLHILATYPEATKIAREKHDGSLPLHCAVSFGCSGRVLNQIIMAFPDGLSHTENSGNTPLHLLFHTEINTKRWDLTHRSDDLDGDELLSETAICKLLLDFIPDATMSLFLKMKNRKGHTVVQAAERCAKLFPVPRDLIELLKEAECGNHKYEKQPARDNDLNAGMTVDDPYTLSTDGGSDESESDSSSDDLSD